jgi:predicted HD superfamily hydrolase involved in NAD metabolism
MFDRERIREAVRAQMPERRWRHTLGVVESALALAERYGADAERAELAAYLHDYAKFWPIDRQRQTLIDAQLPQDLLAYDPQLLHAPVGAYAVQRDLGIEDAEVLDAVRWHTSGREGMTLLDKIICLADYIEPGRNYPGVDDIRKIAEISLERALVAGFDSTIRFLMDQGKPIYPLTVLARNSLLRELKGTHNEGGDVRE